MPGSASTRRSGAAIASAPRRCSTRAASPTTRSRSTTTPPSGRRVYDLGRRWTVPLVMIDGEPIGGYRELAALDRVRASSRRSPSGSARERPQARRSERLAARQNVVVRPPTTIRSRAARSDRRLTAPTVGAELVLHRARTRPRGARSRGASSPGARSRVRRTRRMERCRRASSSPRGCLPGGAGAAGRVPERLVGVDVPEPGDRPLVERAPT